MNRINESSELATRRAKLDTLRNQSVDAYADRFSVNHGINSARSLPDGASDVAVAGRVFSIRNLGKLIFGHLSSAEGRIQFALKRQVLGEDFAPFRKSIDVGDHIGIVGAMFTTGTGEKTIDVSSWTLLSKALRPLPEKHHGIVDKEQILRKRYLDLIMSSESVDRFRTRAKVIRFLRDFLDGHGFVEVDTPILVDRASGALATPFATHHNALDFDVYLRIAPETYLKRAIAGGFDRVYEMARCFRNEGMDKSHLPDFTMLEYYAAYWDYRDNMRFTEELLKKLLLEVQGKLELTYGDHTINFDGKWPTISFRELLLADAELDIAEHRTKDALLTAIEHRGISLGEDFDPQRVGYGTLVDMIYKKFSRPKLVDPVFLVEHPIDLSPLARSNNENPEVVDRFQLVVNGMEVINAYSELIDPIEQRTRLETQMEMRRAGDDQTMEIDESFLLAMEHGMPPMSGWGMGVDRVVALITNSETLRDVVMFPLMRPEERT